MSLSPLAQIADYINQGRCALFAGPDLGESANGYRGLPTSWQLADGLAARCGYRGRFQPLPQIAQIFENKLGRQTMIDYLQQQLSAPDYRPLPVHELIARIPFPLIVHGGWDILLEQALADQQVHFDSVRRNVDLPFVSPAEKRLLLYKPYGRIDDPGSLLITEDDQLGMFYDLARVVARLKDVMEQYALLLISYAPAQDTTFVRLYYEIRRLQAGFLLPAVAVQSLAHAEDAAAWESRGITTVIEEPAAFLGQLAETVAQMQGRQLTLPDLSALSTAPPLTPAELKEQENVLNSMMDQIGVADLIEQTNVPLLSVGQLRDIEAMRAAYERLAKSFALSESSAHIWLRQGNLEYARDNYARAETYYWRALTIEPNLAEVYHNLHYVQLARGDWSEALESYQRAVDLRPELAILPARYQIEAVLGGGGVGVVYRAYDTQMEKPVAIKLLQQAKAQTEQILAVFKREANILQSLEHPNIVRMIDFQSYRGNYFIVMEYLEGQSLKAALQDRSEPFSLDHTFYLIEQVGDALDYAHTKSIIHRDVKPSNIFLVDNQACLIDFGLARPLTPGEQSTLNAVSGTISYLAPEQARGEPANRRTDVYGLATVFYEMLTQRNPSQGAYRSLSELRPGLNIVLDTVVEQAREHNPNNRYPTVPVFLKALRQAIAMQAASAHTPLMLRLVDRAAQAVKTSIGQGWFIWLGTGLGLGIILPALWPTAVVLREMARYLAAGLAITFLLSILGIASDSFMVMLARRVRSTAIPTYGPALGLVLGVINSILWLRSLSFEHVKPEPRLGYAELVDYLLSLTTACLVLSLGVAVVTFLVLLATGALALRLHRKYASGFFVAYLLLCGVLLILGISLPFGWFGDASPAPTLQNNIPPAP